MAFVSITYKCCKATYSGDTRMFPTPVEIVPAFDRLHAEDHPKCPPLDAPLPDRAA